LPYKVYITLSFVTATSRWAQLLKSWKLSLCAASSWVCNVFVCAPANLMLSLVVTIACEDGVEGKCKKQNQGRNNKTDRVKERENGG